MEWSMEALRALEVPEEAASALLAARAEENAALAEREARALSAARQTALREALRQAGALENTLPLLAQSVDPDSLEVADGCLQHAERVLRPLRQAYPGLFAAQLTPPLSPGGELTRDRIAAMSDEEINRCWPSVAAALRQL